MAKTIRWPVDIFDPDGETIEKEMLFDSVTVSPSDSYTPRTACKEGTWYLSTETAKTGNCTETAQ